jgi:protein-tyrosine-phosphatase
MPADGVYVDWMQPRSLGLEEHRSMRFHASLAARYDLILVMEEHQRLRICAALPALHGRVQLFGRWTGGTIADPHRRSLSEYRQCLRAIEDSIEAWQARWLVRAARPIRPMAGVACAAV